MRKKGLSSHLYSRKNVSAFAIPGDVIDIFEELVKEVKSENELMMILGYELRHFAKIRGKFSCSSCDR